MTSEEICEQVWLMGKQARAAARELTTLDASWPWPTAWRPAPTRFSPPTRRT